MKKLLLNIVALLIAVAAAVTLDQSKFVHIAPLACKIVVGVILYLFTKLIMSLLFPAKEGEIL